MTQIADRFASYSGSKSGQELLDQLGQESGLDLPGDVETLLGSSTALSISKDFDYEAAAMSDDGSGVPVAVTVKGDPAAIEKVLAKLRAQAHGSAATLGSDSSGDLVAIGPTAAYRQQILAGGHLGDTDAFRARRARRGAREPGALRRPRQPGQGRLAGVGRRPGGGRQPGAAAGVRVLGVDRRRRRPELARDLDELKRAVEHEVRGLDVARAG